MRAEVQSGVAEGSGRCAMRCGARNIGRAATFVAIALAGLMAVSSIASASGGPKKRKKPRPRPSRVERVVEETYSGPAVASTGTPAGNTFACFPSARIGCVDLQIDPTLERFFELRIEDGSGAAVRAIAVKDDSGDVLADVCSETKTPTPLPAGTTAVTVYVALGPCNSGVSVATAGTVRVVLSNLP